MEAEKENIIAKSTEEVRDIIDRMPVRTGRIVAVIVLALAAFLVFFGFIIEYPEKVSGPVSVTARQAPVKLVANSSGKLRLFKASADSITENEIIACIENPASFKDIMKIEDFLSNHNPDSLFISPYYDSLSSLSLGELSSSFYNFLNYMERIGQYNSGKPWDKKIESLSLLLKSQLKLQTWYQKQLNIKRNTLRIAGKSLKRDSILFKSSAISEQDIDRSSINYFGVLEANQKMEEENTTLKIQIDDTRHKMQMLTLDQNEMEQKLRSDLVTSYNEMVAAIRKWKLTYTFSSPITGTLEYLNFWRENDFITAGTEVFSVIPSDNPILGQVYLPSQGAGKVAVGQDVIIKLDNYPYIEYGSVKGKVKTISSIANQVNRTGGLNPVNTYLILIDLPENLTTNYGVSLDFRYEIKGVADILTRKRKLIVRLFDNLKYIASKK